MEPPHNSARRLINDSRLQVPVGTYLAAMPLHAPSRIHPLVNSGTHKIANTFRPHGFLPETAGRPSAEQQTQTGDASFIQYLVHWIKAPPTTSSFVKTKFINYTSTGAPIARSPRPVRTAPPEQNASHATVSCAVMTSWAGIDARLKYPTGGC